MTEGRIAMQHAKLFDELQQKELTFHDSEVRTSTSQLNNLLHVSFFESSHSSGSYGKQTALQKPPAETANTKIRAQNFSFEHLAPDVTLLRYQSFEKTESGEYYPYSNRSSLWQRTDKVWQLRFHQGTATAAIAVEDML